MVGGVDPVAVVCCEDPLPDVPPFEPPAVAGPLADVDEFEDPEPVELEWERAVCWT